MWRPSRSSAVFRTSILYDNTKLAVARILGDGTRQRTRVFSELQSHYPFADRFGRPGKATTKARWRVWSGWSGGTTWCRFRMRRVSRRSTNNCWRIAADASARLRGHDATIGALARDQACFHDLPVSPYDACEKRPGRVSLAVAGALSQHRLLGADRLRVDFRAELTRAFH